MATESSLPRFAIQLIDAYLYDGQVRRSPLRDWAGEPPGSLTVKIEERSVNEERSQVQVQIRVEVVFEFREGAVVDIEAAVRGVFALGSGVDNDFLEAFTKREALVLLWPYLRSTIADIAGLTQTSVAPLPTLDVAQLMELAERLPIGAPPTSKSKLRKPRATASAAAKRSRTASSTQPADD
ncbi:MAG TPA: protein-export chaperone SecB [Candidatus Saccharimonadales bacterium]|nr:protein-export chaperone SecB [Candidatus Saccharimonadales bacterium]